MATQNYYDKIAPIYDASRYLPQEVADAAGTFFADEGGLSAAAVVAEIGIGTGTNVLPLVPLGVRIVGTEQSAGMLQEAERRLTAANANFALSDHDRLPLPFGDESVDAVLTIHVVHAFPDHVALLAEIARIRKPGGVYFFGEYLLPPHRRDFEALYYQALTDVSPPRPTVAERRFAPSLDTVRDELERRGEEPQSRTIASWEVTETVGQLLGWYKARAFGSCWGMPDQLFDAALRVLETRLIERHGGIGQRLQSQAVYDVLWSRKR